MRQWTRSGHRSRDNSHRPPVKKKFAEDRSSKNFAALTGWPFLAVAGRAVALQSMKRRKGHTRGRDARSKGGKISARKANDFCPFCFFEQSPLSIPLPLRFTTDDGDKLMSLERKISPFPLPLFVSSLSFDFSITRFGSIGGGKKKEGKNGREEGDGGKLENDWDAMRGEGRRKIGRCCFEAEAVAPGGRKRKKMYVSGGDSDRGRIEGEGDKETHAAVKGG